VLLAKAAGAARNPGGLIARNAEDTSQVVEEGKTISISPGCRDTIAVECGGTPLPGFPWQ